MINDRLAVYEYTSNRKIGVCQEHFKDQIYVAIDIVSLYHIEDQSKEVVWNR